MDLNFEPIKRELNDIIQEHVNSKDDIKDRAKLKEKTNNKINEIKNLILSNKSLFISENIVNQIEQHVKNIVHMSSYVRKIYSEENRKQHLVELSQMVDKASSQLSQSSKIINLMNAIQGMSLNLINPKENYSYFLSKLKIQLKFNEISPEEAILLLQKKE